MGELFAGRYELLDPIASGGMGTVWRVLDHSDGEVKAAKMLRQADAAMLLRFVREQSVRIDHTHVVTPLSWAGVDDRVLFTMPLVRGGSVAGLLKRHGPLAPYWIGHLTDQTLQALEAVHAAGVVHRDVKPANLLLEPTGTGRPHLRLTDFGIAVPTDEPRLTRVAMVIGTPGYMAPEQYGGADPDPAADVYALGVVALEMLTGSRPRGEGPPPPIDVSALRAAPGEPADAAREAALDLIAAATRYDAHDRPSAADLRRHPALRTLLDLPAPGDDVNVVESFPPTPPPAVRATPPTPPVSGTPAPPRSTLPPPPPPPVSAPPPSTAAATAPTAAFGPVGTAPLTAAATRVSDGTVGRGPTPGRRTVLPGAALLALGVLGLIVSALLMLL